jgi:hypothetical protein
MQAKTDTRAAETASLLESFGRIGCGLTLATVRTTLIPQ